MYEHGFGGWSHEIVAIDKRLHGFVGCYECSVTLSESILSDLLGGQHLKQGYTSNLCCARHAAILVRHLDRFLCHHRCCVGRGECNIDKLHLRRATSCVYAHATLRGNHGRANAFSRCAHYKLGKASYMPRAPSLSKVPCTAHAFALSLVMPWNLNEPASFPASSRSLARCRGRCPRMGQSL